MQLKYVVDPYGEVNVHPAAAGKIRVRATILMEPHREGTQTGIAIDGSGSMANLYGGIPTGGALSALFGRKQVTENVISPVAQTLCAYLARNLDADHGTTCIYWATGPAGSQVQVVGDFTADQAEKHVFGPPHDFGTGTQLLPAVRYFVERFADAPWGFYIFITDGELHDLDDVKQYSNSLAHAIAAKKRNPLKFVLIGIGDQVNEAQMEALDDLDTGTDVDLWDHKLASEIRVLQQIFAEVVDKNARVAPRGKILTPEGKVVKDFSDTGVPALLDFEMPAGAAYFTLEIPGHRIHQGLSDKAIVPETEDTVQPEEKKASSAPVSSPIPAAASKAPESKVTQPKASEPKASEPAKSPDGEEEWLGFDLKFENQPDIKLEPSDDEDKRK